jgi:hypothetical protein
MPEWEDQARYFAAGDRYQTPVSGLLKKSTYSALGTRAASSYLGC